MSARQLALAWLAGLVLLPGPALAHAEMVTVEPAEGSRVDVVPTEVTISFTEPPTTAARVVVVDGCGDEVQSAVTVSNRQAVALVEPGAQPGPWRVSWSVISAVDGHGTRGQAGFAVSGRPSCSTESPAPAASAPPIAAPPPASEDGGSPLLPVTLGAAGIALVALLLRLTGGR
jgi:methionine-rich copper-binding protein CopC